MTDPRREIAARRLVNQRLVGASLGGASEVARWLGAVQAQEYPVARWSLGQRARGLTEADVDSALAEGQILRTHVLRDTWHLVAAEDIRWLVELTRPRIQARNATMHRRLGLEPRTLARTDAMLVDALASHGRLTRRQLGSFLREHGVETESPRLAYILMHAELELLICSGGLDGKQQTYAPLEERARQAASLPREEALAELTKRYFTSHGPATPKDFGWWASLTLADARLGIDLLAAELESMEVGGRTYWSRSSAASPAAPAPRAHLLQAYDEYVNAYSESKDVFDVEGLARVVPPDRTMFAHAVLLDGQVVGHWRRRLAREAMTIDVQLAVTLDGAGRDAVDDAVERYGRFVGLPAAWLASAAGAPASCS